MFAAVKRGTLKTHLLGNNVLVLVRYGIIKCDDKLIYDTRIIFIHIRESIYVSLTFNFLAKYIVTFKVERQ